jgi:hypothetical protein
MSSSPLIPFGLFAAASWTAYFLHIMFFRLKKKPVAAAAAAAAASWPQELAACSNSSRRIHKLLVNLRPMECPRILFIVAGKSKREQRKGDELCLLMRIFRRYYYYNYYKKNMKYI